MKKCCQPQEQTSLGSRIFNWLIIIVLVGVGVLAVGQVLFA